MSVTIGGVTYNVTPADVADAATFCSNTAAEVEIQLNTLKAYCDQMAEYWAGPAATQFHGLMDEYQAAANGIQLALNQISDGLNGTSVNYSQAEEAAVQAEQQIVITGGAQPVPANLS
jgi:WXG100 family type VII secretion target